MKYLNKNMVLPDDIEEPAKEKVQDIFNINENTIFEDAKYDDEHKYPIFILLMHTGTPLTKVIKAVTKAEYSHACISFNPGLDPMYSFGEKTKTGESGFGFVSQNTKADFYKHHKAKYGVYVMFVSKQSRDFMKEKLEYFKKNNDKMKYDCFGLIQVFFNQATDYKNYKYFCSRFVMDIIQTGGDKLDKAASLWKPEDIKQLQNISLVNSGDDLFHYSRSKTLANMKNQFGYKPITESEDIDYIRNTMSKYMISHPALQRIISLAEQDENRYYRSDPVVATINIQCKNDILKVNNLLEYCNKLVSSKSMKLDSSPIQENIESVICLIQ